MPLCPACKNTINLKDKICPACGIDIRVDLAPGKAFISNIVSRIFSKEAKDYPANKTDETYTIIVVSGEDRGKKFRLTEKPSVIGRKLSYDTRKEDIIINDKEETMAIEQAKLFWHPERNIHVIDSGGETKNPTIVNGMEIKEPAFLVDGCEIIIGKNVLLYKKDSKEDLKEKNGIEIYDLPADGKDSRNELTEKEINDKTVDLDDSTITICSGTTHEFKIVKGPDKGKQFIVNESSIEKKLVIGCKGGDRKDIELADREISECYASLIMQEGWLCITLEDEKGELFVNNRGVIKKGLEKGDIIKIGRNIIEYTSSGNDNCRYLIEIIEGPDKGKIFPLNKKLFRIGRKGKKKGSEKEIELSGEDKTISRLHARIEKKDGEFILINEKENNITFLKGLPITESGHLSGGDNIRVGKETVLLVRETGMPFVPGIIGPPADISEEHTVKVEESQSREKEILEADKRKEVFYYSGGEEVEKSEGYKSTVEEKTLKVDTGEEKKSDGDDTVGTVTAAGYVEQIKKPSLQEISPDRGMILVPGGKFLMGTDHVKCESNPLHTVFIKPFYIDKYPVTNLQYSDFVLSTGYQSQGNWQDLYMTGKEDYPATGVSFEDARQYASWQGKRLPTEAEWEKAARGDDGRLYPWGKEWDREKTNSFESNHGCTTPVNYFPSGSSPYGVTDMLGNIWEWTEDLYFPYPYKGPYPYGNRSEERRVGKECRSRWSPYH